MLIIHDPPSFCLSPVVFFVVIFEVKFACGNCNAQTEGLLTSGGNSYVPLTAIAASTVCRWTWILCH